jgi:2-polyprenyl-3-methyl-5-hydroxy-6-metoxy-1,4-benzoquinol methylase
MSVSKTNTEILDTLRKLAMRYPEEMREGELASVERTSFHLGLAIQYAGKQDLVIADIGGGHGLFSTGCAALGMKVTLVDDFGNPVNYTEASKEALKIHEELGVEILRLDAPRNLALPKEHYDVVTTFDSIEHWNHSPRKALHVMLDSLKEQGWMIIGVPNCVNLRKRLTVPFGKGKWSPMKYYYWEDEFRGHTREPDVDDLHYISRDLGLEEVKIYGRNWMGWGHPKLRRIMPILDPLLQLRPTLCSDLYMVGRKPAKK